ncbi:hypothetical protein BSKO_12032 [Bryopsis sp. KO-2023]|nr:hypothetical protein BSKO_12032 [Bryopsis sp. KO-2023]
MGAKAVSFALLLIASQFAAGVRGQDEEDVPQTKEDINAFLEECEFFGELGAAAAASAACDVVLNNCPLANLDAPIKPEAEEDGPVLQAKIAGKQFGADLLKDRLKETLEKSCETRIFESCGTNAFLETESNPDLRDCHNILTLGPGSTVAEFCPDIGAANCLFNVHVDRICGKTEEADELSCLPEEEEEEEEEEEDGK